MSFLKHCKEQGLIDLTAFDKLSLFADLILQWNPRINLTGFKTREPLEEVLLGEAILALPHLGLTGEQILDFGSGAGIPGLVWAICRPAIALTSLESRHKKVAFQKEAARVLSLQAEILAGRFPEQVAMRQFDVIVSRAIRFSPSLWNEAEMLLRAGGRLVRFMKAQEPPPGWATFSLSSRAALAVRKV